ncbi:MAG: hypothetical protein ACRDPL_15850, partial [Propionibacteriaceae bacterium]
MSSYASTPMGTYGYSWGYLQDGREGTLLTGRPLPTTGWAISSLRSSAVRIWLSHSVPSRRPFGSWSPRSQRHVVIIASTRIR